MTMHRMHRSCLYFRFCFVSDASADEVRPTVGKKGDSHRIAIDGIEEAKRGKQEGEENDLLEEAGVDGKQCGVQDACGEEVRQGWKC